MHTFKLEIDGHAVEAEFDREQDMTKALRNMAILIHVEGVEMGVQSLAGVMVQAGAKEAEGGSAA